MAPPPRPREAPPPGALRAFLWSFGFAWDGLVEAARRERNLRVHLALGLLASAFVARVPLAPAERALLLLCVAIVIAAEAANAALEAVVDLASPGWHDRARLAKDAAAGAVLALAAGSVLAFVAIAVPHLAEVRAAASALAAPAAAAAAAALSAALLATPAPRPAAVDVALAAIAVGGLGVVARGAPEPSGVAAGALVLAIALGAARRRRRAAARSRD